MSLNKSQDNSDGMYKYRRINLIFILIDDSHEDYHSSKYGTYNLFINERNISVKIYFSS